MRVRNIVSFALVLIALYGCTSVGIQYRKYTGDVDSILIVSDSLPLGAELKADLSKSRFRVGLSSDGDSKIPNNLVLGLANQNKSDLRKAKDLGYDSVLVVTAKVGGDGNPDSAVLVLVDTSNSEKILAGTWTGTGDDYTTYGYEPSPEYKKLILEGRKTFGQASQEIAARVIREIPRTWW